MFTLHCSHYTKTFTDIVDLINDIVDSGQDPNYEIIHNGDLTGEFAIDYIVF